MTVRVRVHNAAIQSMFLPGGDINGFGRRISNATTARCNIFALNHMRTGRLRRSFSTRSEVRRNKVRYTVRSSAEHALFLERGTRPQGGWVKLYGPVTAGVLPRSAANPRWHAYIGAVTRGVAGTKPTRFMSRALRSALRANGLV